VAVDVVVGGSGDKPEKFKVALELLLVWSRQDVAKSADGCKVGAWVARVGAGEVWSRMG
jgi:hypothetical protein